MSDGEKVHRIAMYTKYSGVAVKVGESASQVDSYIGEHGYAYSLQLCSSTVKDVGYMMIYKAVGSR